MHTHTSGKIAAAKNGVPSFTPQGKGQLSTHLGKPFPSHRGLVIFQPLGALANALCSWFQMMSFPKSPFPARGHFDVSGTVGGLSLTSPSGQRIPVKNLSEYIEVGLGYAQKSGGTSEFFFNLVGSKISWL